MSKKRSVVDLFAGAGGLSEGFQVHDCQFIAYVEKDSHACDTLLTRHIYWELLRSGKRELYLDYLKRTLNKQDFLQLHDGLNPVINTEVSNKTIPDIIEQIHKNMAASGTEHIDIFIGGPPCQAYSLIGRARDPYRMENDPRNILYKHYVRLLKEFQPKVFVFENVPGILTAGKGSLFKDVCRLFERAGYKLEYRMLDSSDFMVLQKRRRVILIGWKKDLDLAYPDFLPESHNYKVKDALVDLPPLEPGGVIDPGSYSAQPSEYLSKLEIRKPDDVLTQHITRPLIDRDRDIYKIALEKWYADQQRLRYIDLPDHLKTHKNQKSFPDRFKVVAPELSACHTVVAHISKDGHYYIHPDQKQIRSLSVREAARLQSFPDDYFFEGPRTSILAQVGNAVPPLMAERIASKVKGFFQ
jgi:DNA (cytosine-5)-methyltransferase 1